MPRSANFSAAAGMVFASSTLTFLSACEPAHPPTPERPNILFVVTDDQRYDALGIMGNPYIDTPNLDELARQGTLFENAYIMGANHGAVCAPSRAMMLSGLVLNRVYSELGQITTDEWDNDDIISVYRPFNDALNDIPTFPQVLRNNGYRTFGTGKWHQARPSFSNAFDEGNDIFFGGMADHFNTPFFTMNPDSTYERSESRGFSTTIITDATLGFFDRYARENRTEPFFAYVSYTAPHDPRSPDDAWLGYYTDEGMPLPANMMAMHPFNLGNMTIRDEQLGPWPRTPEQIRMHTADYFALITQIDDDMGRMLERLDAHGLRENTIVVFVSDNGLSMGSHGLLGKQSLYEHATKVPLFFSGPGIPANERTDALVLLQDLFPTITELGRVDAPENLDGFSLLPLMHGETTSVRDKLFTMYWDHIRAIRDDRYKLIVYPLIHHVQLFDLQNDPYELNNLAERTEYQGHRQRLMAALEQAKIDADDHFPMFTSRQYPKEYSVDIVRAAHHQPPYVRERFFEHLLD